MTIEQGALKAYLEDAADRVRNIETRAAAALKTQGQAAYEEAMREKAELLAGLSGDAGGRFPDLDEPLAARLRRFSASARRSLDIGSVFFMSALLYPEDYREGEPNDLERFAGELGDAG